MMNEKSLREYEAVKNSAGWRELDSRSKVHVLGPDRLSFLHAMVSNDIQSADDFEGVYTTLLTATGKIIADFYLYRFPDFLMIDVEEELLSKLIEKLESYVIMDDVQFEDVSNRFRHFSIQGPESIDLVESEFGLSVPSTSLKLQSGAFEDGRLWCIRKNELSPRGVELVVEHSIGSEVQKRLAESRAPEIGFESYEVLRIERGIPLYGKDMTEKNNPIEARLEKAYSLSKGCYVGQEVLAKATNIGGVARLLTRLRLDEGVCPEPGTRVLADDGKDIGWITSAVLPPDSENSIAFAYLKRAFSNEGQVHKVPVEEKQLVSAEVILEFPEED